MSKKLIREFMQDVKTGRKETFTKNEIVKRMGAKFEIEMDKFNESLKAKQTDSKKKTNGRTVTTAATARTTGSKKKLSRPSRREQAEETASLSLS